MPSLIIDDSKIDQANQERLDRLEADNGEKLGGCLQRKIPYGCIAHIPKATEIIGTIPRKEWAELIAEGKGTFLHDLTKGKLPSHDQGGTNYCWAHGSVRTAEVLRVFEGQSPIILSAESVAVPVTGGRNRGGYPEEALHQLRNYGACDQSYWPKNDRNEKNAQSGWEEDAKRHRLIRWMDVKGFEMQMTLALLRIPVAIGLGWWSHLVCQLDPIHYGGNDFGLGCDNSWGSDYGDQGHFELTERRGTADLGAFAPITENFSNE